MATEVTFINDHEVKVVTERGEEAIGYLRMCPAQTDEQRQAVIETVQFAFDKSENIVEAQNFIQMSSNTLTFGMIFQYTVPPSEALKRRLGARLREIRERRGMSGRELSYLTHIDPSNLSRIEQGKHAISVETLFRILYYLDAELKLEEKEIPEHKKYNRTKHFE